MKTPLLKDFYTVLNSNFSETCDSSFDIMVKLNAEHPVYKGHFPQTPIAPGVCLTQIIKEELSRCFQRELRMISADNIKFLSLINPRSPDTFTITFTIALQENIYNVSANYVNGEITYMKFKGKFQILS